MILGVVIEFSEMSNNFKKGTNTFMKAREDMYDSFQLHSILKNYDKQYMTSYDGYNFSLLFKM